MLQKFWYPPKELVIACRYALLIFLAPLMLLELFLGVRAGLILLVLFILLSIAVRIRGALTLPMEEDDFLYKGKAAGKRKFIILILIVMLAMLFGSYFIVGDEVFFIAPTVAAIVFIPIFGKLGFSIRTTIATSIALTVAAFLVTSISSVKTAIFMTAIIILMSWPSAIEDSIKTKRYAREV